MHLLNYVLTAAYEIHLFILIYTSNMQVENTGMQHYSHTNHHNAHISFPPANIREI